MDHETTVTPIEPVVSAMPWHGAYLCTVPFTMCSISMLRPFNMSSPKQEYIRNEGKGVSNTHMGLVLTSWKVTQLLLKCTCSITLNKLCAMEIAEITTAHVSANMRVEKGRTIFRQSLLAATCQPCLVH